VIIGKGNFNYSPFLDFVRGFEHIVTLEAITLDTSLETARKSIRNFRKIIAG
jgi:sugar phosphate isomerase/epimerase